MSLLLVLGAIVALGAVVSFALWHLPAYRAWGGTRHVICPGTPEEGRVRVDQLRFAVTSLNDRPVVRIRSCSRWPENADCEERCFPQLDAGRDGFPRAGR